MADVLNMTTPVKAARTRPASGRSASFSPSGRSRTTSSRSGSTPTRSMASSSSSRPTRVTTDDAVGHGRGSAAAVPRHTGPAPSATGSEPPHRERPPMPPARRRSRGRRSRALGAAHQGSSTAAPTLAGWPNWPGFSPRLAHRRGRGPWTLDGDRVDPGLDLALWTGDMPHDTATTVGQEILGKAGNETVGFGPQRRHEHAPSALARDLGHRGQGQKQAGERGRCWYLRTQAYRSVWRFWQASAPATIRCLLRPHRPVAAIALVAPPPSRRTGTIIRRGIDVTGRCNRYGNPVCS